MKRAVLFLLLVASASVQASSTETAIFAGGCFWCTESDFEKIPGVLSAVSGYTGGKVTNPGYDQVSAGSTGHTEAVKIVFDPDQVSYAQLLEKFWLSIDPTTKDRQFCDAGTQYRSGIYPLDQAQMNAALASKGALEKSGRIKGPIYTEIVTAGPFYPAEDYHQDYYKNNPVRYKFYRSGCGRDRRIEQIWGKSAGH